MGIETGAAPGDPSSHDGNERHPSPTAFERRFGLPRVSDRRPCLAPDAPPGPFSRPTHLAWADRCAHGIHDLDFTHPAVTSVPVNLTLILPNDAYAPTPLLKRPCGGA